MRIASCPGGVSSTSKTPSKILRTWRRLFPLRRVPLGNAEMEGAGGSSSRCMFQHPEGGSGLVTRVYPGRHRTEGGVPPLLMGSLGKQEVCVAGGWEKNRSTRGDQDPSGVSW